MLINALRYVGFTMAPAQEIEANSFLDWKKFKGGRNCVLKQLHSIEELFAKILLRLFWNFTCNSRIFRLFTSQCSRKALF